MSGPGGKQNQLFPEGTDIKCFVIHPNNEQMKKKKRTNKLALTTAA